MDFDFILTHTPAFLAAAWLTVKLGFLGAIFALLIGFFCVLMRFFKLKFFTALCQIYIEFSRNTPLLIQLFFLYYALPKLGVRLEHWPLLSTLCLSVDEILRPAFACAVVGLSFLGGSYMAEALRAGFEAVRRQQFEAGLALGFGAWGILRFIVLPQALRVALPALSANVIFFIKETSVVSIIALPDLVTLMKGLNSLTYKTDELLLMLFLGYLLIILPLSLGLWFFEKRLTHA
ncbi:amino acid ABC transporter permease [Campylobacter sp.]|uniref:amino acid ABC transporter permease n=1 Tax=Campylobacter sp. TaxID=205 RepID=UPI0026DC0483|nr:amino acid ABC transporter permease [Campylobacter sp.]MDO4673721.1 amino acid ABC transporter permease [Campylobacter sp.]